MRLGVSSEGVKEPTLGDDPTLHEAGPTDPVGPKWDLEERLEGLRDSDRENLGDTDVLGESVLDLQSEEDILSQPVSDSHAVPDGVTREVALPGRDEGEEDGEDIFSRDAVP